MLSLPRADAEFKGNWPAPGLLAVFMRRLLPENGERRTCPSASSGEGEARTSPRKGPGLISVFKTYVRFKSPLPPWRGDPDSASGSDFKENEADRPGILLGKDQTFEPLM